MKISLIPIDSYFRKVDSNRLFTLDKQFLLIDLFSQTRREYCRGKYREERQTPDEANVLTYRPYPID